MSCQPNCRAGPASETSSNRSCSDTDKVFHKQSSDQSTRWPAEGSSAAASAPAHDVNARPCSPGGDLQSFTVLSNRRVHHVLDVDAKPTGLDLDRRARDLAVPE